MFHSAHHIGKYLRKVNRRNCHVTSQSLDVGVKVMTSQFVPSHREPSDDDVEKLSNFIRTHRKLFTITGAGISTESGIPDYRSEEVGLYARGGQGPMQYQEFIKSEKSRQRYWARNYVGWPRFSSFQPNRVHRLLSDWERRRKVWWLVTQNVDALHVKAGSHYLTELHGCTDRVVCLDCGDLTRRDDLQGRISALNPGWIAVAGEVAPDGDIEIDPGLTELFRTPHCEACGGGVLKPDVVFFGDNVARRKVDFLRGKLSESDAVLVLGSSLQVFSAFRFIRAAEEECKPVCIVNIGPTRGDKLASLIINTKCSSILDRVHARLYSPS